MLLCLALLTGWALPSGAGAAEDLYVGEVPAEAVNGDARAPILDALNQVLVRLTGRAGQDLVAELGIAPSRAEALALGRQFRREEFVEDSGAQRARRMLRVDFDPRSVDALLDQAGLPRWGSERPELLLWIVTEEAGGAEYLIDDPVIDRRLREASFGYGIPLTRPILDALDRVEVTPADIRGGFTAAARAAMRRHAAEGIVMLDLRRAGPPGAEYWTGRWAWRIGDEENAFQRSGATPAEVVDLGLGRIAGALAARFAVRADARRARRISVSGINSPMHFNEVRRYLQALTGVQSVRVIGARADVLQFEVIADSDGLRQRIELTGPLEFQRHDLATGELFYRFAW